MSNALTPFKFIIGLSAGMILTLNTVEYFRLENPEEQFLCALFYGIIASYWAAKNTTKIPE